jgi:hypothetical protein
MFFGPRIEHVAKNGFVGGPPPPAGHIGTEFRQGLFKFSEACGQLSLTLHRQYIEGAAGARTQFLKEQLPAGSNSGTTDSLAQRALLLRRHAEGDTLKVTKPFNEARSLVAGFCFFLVSV